MLSIPPQTEARVSLLAKHYGVSPDVLANEVLVNYLDKSAEKTKKKEVLSVDKALTQARNALKKCGGGGSNVDLVNVLKDLRNEDLADEDKRVAGH
jgi:hypothetical protein